MRQILAQLWQRPDYLAIFGLSAFAVLLPFQWKYIPITLAFLIYCLGFVLGFLRRKVRPKLNAGHVLWLAYYILLLLGLLWPHNTSEAGRQLEVQITLLIWPLTLGLWPALPAAWKNRVLQLFLWAASVSVVVQVAWYGYEYLTGATGGQWVYVDVARWGMVPAHYQALYVSWAIVLVVHQWRLTRNRWYILWALVLGALLSLMAVRIQWIALPLAVLTYGLFAVKRVRWIHAGYAALILALAVGTIAAVPQTKQRLADTWNELRSIQGQVDGRQTNPRVFLWSQGWEIVKDHPFGVGTGNENDTLAARMQKVDAVFWDGTTTFLLNENYYNYHNTFLQQAARLGWLGLGVLLMIVLWPCVRQSRPHSRAADGRRSQLRTCRPPGGLPSSGPRPPRPPREPDRTHGTGA